MTQPVRAVIFDFDGLIVDTETPEYLAWQAVYALHGWSLSLDAWLQNVGRNDGPFDPLAPFREPASPMPPDGAKALWRDHHDRLQRDAMVPLPGVVALLDDLRRRRLLTAVASSSRSVRVHEMLRTLGLLPRFDAVACGDEVPHAKPAPDVYLLAARRLRVLPAACVAFEDSAYGVRAAKTAGMPCIAVPSKLTRTMDFSAADLVVASLTDVSAATIQRVADAGAAPRG